MSKSISNVAPSFAFGNHGDTAHPAKHQLMHSAQRHFQKGLGGGLDIGTLNKDDKRVLAQHELPATHKGGKATPPHDRGEVNKPSFDKHSKPLAHPFFTKLVNDTDKDGN